MKRILLTALILAAAPALQADPFKGSDPAKGRELMSKAKCDGACHTGRVGGDGSKMYTRADRKVKSPQSLTERVQMCNTMLKTNWFPEDEGHVAAYLNQQYYKFK